MKQLFYDSSYFIYMNFLDDEHVASVEFPSYQVDDVSLSCSDDDDAASRAWESLKSSNRLIM